MQQVCQRQQARLSELCAWHPGLWCSGIRVRKRTMDAAWPIPGLCFRGTALEVSTVLPQAPHLLSARLLLRRCSAHLLVRTHDEHVLCVRHSQLRCWCALQWTNIATVAFMVFGSNSPRFGTMVYALADGPMAAALIVWQSAWVFGSAAHCVR